MTQNSTVTGVGRFQTKFVEFDSHNLEPVVTQMRRLSDHGDGSGWINVGPALRNDQIERLPVPSAVGRWFSGRGPIIPMATWSPPRAKLGSGVGGASAVGIAHGTGPKALDRLREAGVPLPAGWHKVQDHAKNGIVAHPAIGTSDRDILKWMVAACQALCPIRIDDHWLAEIHHP